MGADTTYMQSLFGFPAYDAAPGKASPYAAGSSAIPMNAGPFGAPVKSASPFHHPLIGSGSVAQMTAGGAPGGSVSSSNGGSSSSAGKGLSSLIPSIKLTNTGIRFTGFGSTINTGIGASLNQALASTLGGGGSSSATSGSAGLGSSASNPFYAGLYSTLGLRPIASAATGPSVGPAVGGSHGGYGSSASKIIPSVIRSPFRTMYRALTGASIAA